jgi:hypothetical protein
MVYNIDICCLPCETMYWGQNIHNPIELMGVTIFVMVSSMIIANTVLSRRGDIE